MKDEAIGIADWLIDVMWNDEKGRLTRYTTSHRRQFLYEGVRGMRDV